MTQRGKYKTSEFPLVASPAKAWGASSGRPMPAASKRRRVPTAVGTTRRSVYDEYSYPFVTVKLEGGEGRGGGCDAALPYAVREPQRHEDTSISSRTARAVGRGEA